MQKFFSFQEKFDNVIDPFVSKLMKAIPYFENEESLAYENDNAQEASIETPFEANNCEEPTFEKHKASEHTQAKESVTTHSGEVIMNWVQNHFFELERKIDVKTEEIKQRQQSLEDSMTRELATLNGKMDLILSMLMRSSSKVEVEIEDNIGTTSGVKEDGNDMDDFGDKGSYFTPSSQQHDDKGVDDKSVEVVSPQLRPLRKRKQGRVLRTPYTDPTKRRKFRKGDGCKFNPFREIDPHKQEVFQKWMNDNDTK